MHSCFPGKEAVNMAILGILVALIITRYSLDGLNPLFPTRKSNPASGWSPSIVQEYRADAKPIVPNRVLHKVDTLPPIESSTEKPDTEAEPLSNRQTEAEPLSNRQTEDTTIDEEIPAVSDPFALNEDELSSFSDATAPDEEKEVASTSPSNSRDKKKQAPSKDKTSASKSKFRFGSRMGKSNAPPPNPLLGKNMTYFPKDHQADITVFRFVRTMANVERQVLNKMGPEVKAGMGHFRDVVEQFPPPTDDGKRPRLTAKQQRLFNSMHWQERGEKHCQGCPIDGSFPIRRVTRNPGRLIFRKFVGNQEIGGASMQDAGGDGCGDSRLEPYCENCPFNVTAIMVTTSGSRIGVRNRKTRLFYIQQLLYRWRKSHLRACVIASPMLIVVNGKVEEEKAIIDFIREHYLPKRLTLLLYLVSPRNPQYMTFPVNMLRNLAIRNVRTSHYMIMDMDMWPTLNVNDELNALPDKVKYGKKNAVILPIFFFSRGRVHSRCWSFKECVHFGLNLMPTTKKELASCILTRICESRKPGIRTHLYVHPEWYSFPPSVHVARITCMLADFQEPYVLLKRSPETPLFDERFVNYGYNKVQLIEHLRAMGYHFYILTQAFAMDIPHEDSEFRKNYLTAFRAKELPMREVYSVFQRELNKNYSSISKFPVCKSMRKPYYMKVE